MLDLEPIKEMLTLRERFLAIPDPDVDDTATRLTVAAARDLIAEVERLRAAYAERDAVRCTIKCDSCEELSDEWDADDAED